MSAGWSRSRQMSEFESTMWRANRHPENSTQGGVLQVLDATPDFAEVRAWHEHGMRLFPRFREKVVVPALPVGPPIWADDPDFDLSHHLRRVDLGGTGSHRALLDACQEIASAPLDPARPPWLGTFVEGLEGGRSAYFLVVNHCLMDGVGSVQLLESLHTSTDRPAPLASTDVVDPRPAERPPTPVDVAVGQVRRRLLGAPRSVGGAGRGLVKALRAGPGKNLDYVSSVARVMAPVQPSRSPLFRPGARSSWRYGTASVPLADLKAAGKSQGGTVNDAYLAGVLGGLRRYHEQDGLELDDISINMPVSMRRPDDPEGGNVFVPAFLRAPASIADPAERMRAIRAMVKRAGSEPALDALTHVLPLLNRAPSVALAPLFTSMQNRTNLTISNVPGQTRHGSFVGTGVEAIYYFGPLPGSPVMVVLHSHLGTCHVGLNVDGDVFDVERVVACVEEGIAEVVALARG